MFEVQSRSPVSAKWWFTHFDEIDMEPEYQRAGGIWSEEDQMFLIDSIINGYDIPKIYIADFTTIKSKLNVDKKRFAVIDGKQRLEALFSFFENDLPLSKNFKYEPNTNLQLGGLTYKDIAEKYPELASRVEEFPLPVMHVVTDELAKINQLFVRLNKGLALTGAEKRNAMVGPLPKAIRAISNHEFFGNSVRYKSTRGQNLNAAAKLLLFEFKGGPYDTKKVDLDRLVTDNAGIKRGDLKIKTDKVHSTLTKMRSVFGHRDELLSSQGVVPLYYLFISTKNSAARARIRDFLLKFTNAVRANRTKPDAERNKTLDRYDYLSRSINDAGSIGARLEILETRFGKSGAKN